LSRIFAEPFLPHSKDDQKKIQALADLIAQSGKIPSQVNQSLMELGATICTPKKPICLICPVKSQCQAYHADLVDQLPLPKVRKSIELWSLQFEIPIRPKQRSGKQPTSQVLTDQLGVDQIVIDPPGDPPGEKIIFDSKNPKGDWHAFELGLVQSRELPFLKNQWAFPAKAQKITIPPTDFGFTHSITHHKIFVQVKMINLEDQNSKRKAKDKKLLGQDWKNTKKVPKEQGEMIWVCPTKLKEINPSILLQKALQLSFRQAF
jgi:adenine-specific DNA glycosylase